MYSFYDIRVYLESSIKRMVNIVENVKGARGEPAPPAPRLADCDRFAEGGVAPIAAMLLSTECCRATHHLRYAGYARSLFL